MGWTLQAIGNKYGVSRERVRQLIKAMGISKYEGGRYIAEKKKKEIQKERYLNTYLPGYKCTRKELLKIAPLGITKGDRFPKRFYRHKLNAGARGIGFLLSFPQWYRIWEESGHISEMGQGGYVMARNNDTGAYEIGNVSIKTSSDNFKEIDHSYKNKPRRINGMCKNGHMVTGKNAIVVSKSRVNCRECIRQAALRYYYKHRK